MYDMNKELERELARLERIRAEVAKDRARSQNEPETRTERRHSVRKCAATVMFIGAGVLALPAVALATVARMVEKGNTLAKK